MSVTNAIEEVLEEIYSVNSHVENLPDYKIIYRDSEGKWDSFDFDYYNFIHLGADTEEEAKIRLAEFFEKQNRQILTAGTLKSMPASRVFATGVTSNDPDGVFMSNERRGEKLDWIAKRGDGFHDWAIYTWWNSENKPVSWIMRHGQKVGDMNNVKKLINCDEGAAALYRR